ncbi:MAG: hypothetical protein WA131_01715 [Desulfitobacteriaceae bacterium]
MIHEAIDEWVYFFKHGAIREDFKSPGILLAAKKLDYLRMSEEERRGYNDYLAYLGQELGILDTAKEEGREEGEKKGKLEAARNALIEGIEPTIVAKITGLPLATIRKIKEDLVS